MAILHIAKLGSPILRKKAKPVDPSVLAQKTFQNFLEDLLESMLFHDGVGLAAPQVFKSIRVIVVEVPAEMDHSKTDLKEQIYINPVLTPLLKRQTLGLEGCLSLKDLRGMVPRYPKIKLSALDRNGRPITGVCSGFVARVFQHEVDHLDGVVFLDRMPDLIQLGFMKEITRNAKLQPKTR